MDRILRNSTFVIYVNKSYRNSYFFSSFDLESDIWRQKLNDGRTLHTKILKKFEKLKISKTFSIIGKHILEYPCHESEDNRAIFSKVLAWARVLRFI